MIWNQEQFRCIGEILIRGKPLRIGMTMGTDQWKVFDFLIEFPCHRPDRWVCWKQSIRIHLNGEVAGKY